jgi:hypothetical protein
MEILLSLCVGLGLSAACGFRVFVPLLVMSIATKSGHLTLSPGFDWIGSDTALIAFGLATALEVTGYYVPWVDNFLDSIATPAAIVAGTIVTASMVTDVHPFLKWSLALIGGGGVAGAVQASTVFARGASSLGTAGLANPVLATVELGGAAVGSVLSIFAPILAILLVIGMLVFAGKMIIPKLAAKRAAANPPPVPDQTTPQAF